VRRRDQLSRALVSLPLSLGQLAPFACSDERPTVAAPLSANTQQWQCPSPHTPLAPSAARSTQLIPSSPPLLPRCYPLLPSTSPLLTPTPLVPPPPSAPPPSLTASSHVHSPSPSRDGDPLRHPSFVTSRRLIETTTNTHLHRAPPLTTHTSISPSVRASSVNLRTSVHLSSHRLCRHSSPSQPSTPPPPSTHSTSPPWCQCPVFSGTSSTSHRSPTALTPTFVVSPTAVRTTTTSLRSLPFLLPQRGSSPWHLTATHSHTHCTASHGCALLCLYDVTNLCRSVTMCTL
jgi:hypothetical protein